MNRQEISLIEKTRQGDIDSFEKLIEPYQKKAFNIAYRMLSNIEDANDITQEALLKIFRSVDKFQGKSSFSTWVYSIVSNSCIDFIRKQKKNQVVYLEQQGATGENYRIEVADEMNTPEYLFEKKEIQNIIHEAINQLNVDQKEIIILRDINGFSYQEIANILKCSEGTVKSRINRARGKLKKILLTKELQQA
ncbi:RNA polymerase sigma-70 factor (ECF subfamily) [Alkaliphilus hydrothermalis]|uniref:RNA polymerase sigma-70 factor (ECF subfamily) n=1 Tax=Alkaliphilus hydrothermalis TaxID=1482730 RepID=A0ABS2NQE4_9FIRM|nr:sigma-70 family RNA polymerase sigma factor [Alkaliphilus hydrothermalis]MBM7614829.1 RNA polymerase sigma-70 factor (ECF subfamily) [Alkaliphilus hydrothermalis]